MAGPSMNADEQDDAAIGTAFRRSLWVIGGVALLLLAAWGASMMLARKPVTRTVPLAAVEVRTRTAAEIPVTPFKDVTEDVGLKFVHENGAAGEKLLPETMGGGCAFFDYDGDGDQDVLMVNSCRWPWDGRAASAPATSALFRNDGAGRYENVTAGSGLDTLTFYGQGVATGDYDNDGDADVFLSGVGGSHLLRNDQGRFVDVTDNAGVAGRAEDWSTSCGWLDYDRDGDLDLMVCNYVAWTRETDLALEFQLKGVGRAYGRPQQFGGAFPYLYRNDGDKFTNVAEALGLQVRNAATGIPASKSLGLTFFDFDDDGWLDILVANDTVQNFLFRNLEGKGFEEIGAAAGVAFDNDGQARGAMGCATSQFRNSAEVGIAIGNFANEMTALYVSQGNTLAFTDEAIASGLGPQTRLQLTFGVSFVDIDLDGRPDFVAANGHLEDEISKVQQSQTYEQEPHLFWNCGPAEATEFAPVPMEKCGAEYYARMVGRGLATADIDGDGDQDLLFGATGSAARLVRNDQTLGRHWLRLKLRGTVSNRDAIGARVEVQLADRVLFEQVMPTRSYLSQCELPVTFGLGEATSVEQVRIRWPNGKQQEVEGLAVDRLHEVVEAE